MLFLQQSYTQSATYSGIKTSSRNWSTKSKRFSIVLRHWCRGFWSTRSICSRNGRNIRIIFLRCSRTTLWIWRKNTEWTRLNKWGSSIKDRRPLLGSHIMSWHWWRTQILNWGRRVLSARLIFIILCWCSWTSRRVICRSWRSWILWMIGWRMGSQSWRGCRTIPRRSLIMSISNSRAWNTIHRWASKNNTLFCQPWLKSMKKALESTRWSWKKQKPFKYSFPILISSFVIGSSKF